MRLISPHLRNLLVHLVYLYQIVFLVYTKRKRDGFLRLQYYYSVLFFTSGKPAIEVSIDKIPANADALPTRIQLTWPIIAAVPIVARAV